MYLDFKDTLLAFEHRMMPWDKFSWDRKTPMGSNFLLRISFVNFIMSSCLPQRLQKYIQILEAAFWDQELSRCLTTTWGARYGGHKVGQKPTLNVSILILKSLDRLCRSSWVKFSIGSMSSIIDFPFVYEFEVSNGLCSDLWRLVGGTMAYKLNCKFPIILNWKIIETQEVKS